MKKHWGWSGYVNEFRHTSEGAWLEQLCSHHRERFPDLSLSEAQVRAWREIFNLLQATIVGGQFDKTLLVAEFELPGEAGRRVDVILVVPSGHVMVLEFKGRAKVSVVDFDQVLGYVNDLQGYHSSSQELLVHPYLVMTHASGPVEVPARYASVKTDYTQDGVLAGIRAELERWRKQHHHELLPETWLKGTYRPLPTLVQAVTDAFQNQPLPSIKTTKHLSHLVERLHILIEECERERRHALVLITGAPGAGKTLVGLETVMQQVAQGRKALYLSGNGPLVAVLRDAVNRVARYEAAKALIRGMVEFKPWARSEAYEPHHVFVFDEGQRAWTKVHGYAGSEIQLLLEVAQKQDWGVVIGLIGEGQEIHKGEQGDLLTWVRDFNQLETLSDRWTVFAPPYSLPPLKRGELRVGKALHLDKSIRSKQVLTLHKWVGALLSDRPPEEARVLAQDLSQHGFQLYCTRRRDVAEAYLRALYAKVNASTHSGAPKRFGWVASSECKQSPRNPDGLPQLQGGAQDYERIYGKWYNAPVTDPDSSNQLAKACSEFGCQGLELDFALIHWGDDFRWTPSGWRVRAGVRPHGKKPLQHTTNAYRVLLTRARDGMVIYCPRLCGDVGIDPLFDRITACGVVELDDPSD